MAAATRLLPLLFFALAACAQPTAPDTSGAVQEEVAELWTDDTRTVLSGDAARTLAGQCSRISPGPVEDVWTPDEAQIERVEDDLILRVAREMEARGQSPSPGGYYRQYAGFMIDGRRIIYVNGVDESAIQNASGPAQAFDWRTQPVLICDGGAITFGAEYDPATRQVSHFAFNGPY
ncbi:MAG TPA: hypothetical protein VEA80_14050 [Vitreimonas sp.]|uniref:hypothetical protein n=1 Tax=Vitreimonas sp. TaxID=3069702 RepID=UPI002D370AEB|nr:hypothetical protein [Vitreimonas sp.]HYD88592.1 hypothetical protein [Vitreimonas sp.]